MDMYAIFHKSTEFFDDKFIEKDCVEVPKIEMHKKKKSECHEVTKQNCVTKWEVLENGDKVCTYISSVLFSSG